ncbi:MAG: hypothetical protein JWN40_5938 [Phycisphaerales bacterium]|nr:hypothetical protein [Phycisphaerales bacterium]
MAQVDLQTKFPWMKPVKSAPALFRINGCGVGMYGSRSADAETGTYVSTWCLALVFIPVLCLRAYRVARHANGGWYFLGREPLSAMARGWNILVLLGILATIGGVQYSIHVNSPAYRAQRQMATAKELVTGGQIARAARIYQTLAIANANEADNATAAIRDLMENPNPQTPLSESAGLYAALTQVAHRGQSITPAEVADKGAKLATEKGDSDPRAALAILETVRPMVNDTRKIDDRRLPLLRKLAAAEPNNLEVIVPLASVLEQQNKIDEAKKLLLPIKNQLGDGEGARVLGTILGREGDYDGAYAMLWPFVKTRLDRFHTAETNAEDTIKRIWDREIQLLNAHKGPEEFYTRYDAAGSDEQKTLVHNYVNAQIKDDPIFASSQETLEHEATVVPVALELGIVMLQRAQGQSDPAVRKTQLEATEQVFLAVGGVAGKTDEYRLTLGQVYYWLGKQAEGHKLFDDYLSAKSRAFPDLLAIAVRLRNLGAVPESRAMAEEAYAKASKPDEQHQAANFRALCYKDSDDQIAWLQKSDLGNPSVKASLAKALGDKAMEEGRDDEAARQFHVAADAYTAMPRSATTVNQTALAYYGIFQATGDRPALDRCFDCFQQAVDLEPSDPILLFNVGTTLMDASLADVVGSDIDLRALHESGNISLLSYLYQDEAGRDVIVRKVKAHPGIARAQSYLEKVMVLSPKQGSPAVALYGVHQFTHNEPALGALEQRIRAADLDTSDQLVRAKEFLAGSRDQQNRVTLAAALKRSEALADALRVKGGRTAAVALDQEVEQMLSLDFFTGTTDPAKVVALSQEAYRLSPSACTSGVLMTAYLFQAAQELRRASPAFDAFYTKYNRSVGVTHLMAVAASEPGPFQEQVVRNANVQKALELLRDSGRRFPKGGSPHEWALLKKVDAAEAERIAQTIRTTARKHVEQSITAMLHPASASEAIDTYWMMQIDGKPDDGRAALRKVAAMGIPVPIQP